MTTKPFMRAEIKSAPPQTVHRTLGEAFGPHTSRDLDLMPDPSPSRLEEAVCWIVSALALGFLLLMWLPQ